IELTQILQDSSEVNVQLILSIVLNSLIAALTVGGKAFGKYFAIHSSTHIILFAGKIVYFIENKLKIKIFAVKSKSKNKSSTKNKELLHCVQFYNQRIRQFM